jgi:hypothetical protein
MALINNRQQTTNNAEILVVGLVNEASFVFRGTSGPGAGRCVREGGQQRGQPEQASLPRQKTAIFRPFRGLLAQSDSWATRPNGANRGRG